MPEVYLLAMLTLRRPRSFREKLVAEVESGATVASVARRHRVEPQSLTWWCWRLRRDAPTDGSRLLLIVLEAGPVAASTATTIELEVTDISLHVRVGTEPAYVGALVDVLRRC